MVTIKLLFIFLAFAGKIQGHLVCPESTEAIYYPNTLTDCKEYYVCQNATLVVKTCPDGEIFNYASSQCVDRSEAECVENKLNQEVKLHKRSVEEYHTIEIADVKSKVVDLYHKIKPLVDEAIQEVASSAYSRFEADYLPTIISIKQDVLPFYYEKVLPHVNKAVSYARQMATRVVDKVMKSYELSTSTDIVIPSFSDIAEDVSNDLIKPAVNFGRVFSGRGLSRTKRNAFTLGISDMISGFIRPVFNNVMDTVFKSQSNTILGRVIYPIVKELMKYRETRFDLFKLYVSAKSTFSPILWYMIRQQAYNTPEGIILNIPRHLFEEARRKFHTQMKPIIYKLLEKHLEFILNHLADESEFIVDTVQRIEGISGRNIQLLKDAMLRFATKHGNLLRSSRNSPHVSTYALTEIMADLAPIKVITLQIMAEYLANTPNTIFSELFRPNSFIYKFLEPSTPQYAVQVPLGVRTYRG